MVSVRQETTAPILRKNIKAPGPALLNPPVLKNKIACSPIERRNRGPIMDHYLGLDTRDYSSELQDSWATNRESAQEEARRLCAGESSLSDVVFVGQKIS